MNHFYPVVSRTIYHEKMDFALRQFKFPHFKNSVGVPKVEKKSYLNLARDQPLSEYFRECVTHNGKDCAYRYAVQRPERTDSCCGEMCKGVQLCKLIFNFKITFFVSIQINV